MFHAGTYADEAAEEKLNRLVVTGAVHLTKKIEETNCSIRGCQPGRNLRSYRASPASAYLCGDHAAHRRGSPSWTRFELWWPAHRRRSGRFSIKFKRSRSFENLGDRSSVESPRFAGARESVFPDCCFETWTSLLFSKSDTMRACDRSCSIEGKTAWWSPSAPVCPAACPRANPRNRRLRTLGKLSRPTSTPSKPTACQFLKSTSTHVS